MQKTRRDIHSYSNPEQVRVKALQLDLDVIFERKIIEGTATLDIERWESSAPLILDTRKLKIQTVDSTREGGSWTPAAFKLGEDDPILGAPLTISLPGGATQVRIAYQTDPGASALQWLDPPQTAGKKHPFLFTQSQAIHARSWIPIQDSPGVRMTYRARVRTPESLLAVMSASNDPNTRRTGRYEFQMFQPIPPYLIALAVGDLEFRALGKRTGVYAEPPVVEKAAQEFSDTEKMLIAAEDLYGRYRWQRYDLLVLPPSFPFGGMENPRLTFATPTIIAGDKSLVALVAHELAHSWSGNLVTNATWRDFWLNEGFTVYVERRIQEKVYGKTRADMEAVLGRQTLARDLSKLPERDQILHIDLAGRDPDDGMTEVPYEKGALFLRTIEEAFGRLQFDAFLRKYFDHFAFNSITTGIFVDYLKKQLFEQNPQAAAKIPLDDWLEKPGIPAGAVEVKSAAFAEVDERVKRWLAGSKIDTAGWSTQLWMRFLETLPEQLSQHQMRQLDRQFGFTKSGNAEILDQWLLMSVRNQYEPAYVRAEEFLTSVGRRKYLKPLYEEMVKTPEGKQRAAAIYKKARPGYHPIAQTTVDTILKAEPAVPPAR